MMLQSRALLGRAAQQHGHPLARPVRCVTTRTKRHMLVDGVFRLTALRSPHRRVVRKPTHRVHAQYDRSAREQYLEEVRRYAARTIDMMHGRCCTLSVKHHPRLIDKAEYTSRTQQDGLTKVLIGASLPLLKLIANAPAPDAAPRPPADDWQRSNGSNDWQRSNGSSSWGSDRGYADEPYRRSNSSSSFGGSSSSFGGSTFGRDRQPVVTSNPREDNPQLSGTCMHDAHT